MAVCRITEANGVGGSVGAGHAQALCEPTIRTQSVTIGTVDACEPLRAGTGAVELHADGAACHFRFGAEGTTATTADAKLASGEKLVRAVTPGTGLVVSVIAAS